jgi:hypothetical protein
MAGIGAGAGEGWVQVRVGGWAGLKQELPSVTEGRQPRARRPGRRETSPRWAPRSRPAQPAQLPRHERAGSPETLKTKSRARTRVAPLAGRNTNTPRAMPQGSYLCKTHRPSNWTVARPADRHPARPLAGPRSDTLLCRRCLSLWRWRVAAAAAALAALAVAAAADPHGWVGGNLEATSRQRDRRLNRINFTNGS